MASLRDRFKESNAKEEKYKISQNAPSAIDHLNSITNGELIISNKSTEQVKEEKKITEQESGKEYQKDSSEQEVAAEKKLQKEGASTTKESKKKSSAKEKVSERPKARFTDSPEGRQALKVAGRKDSQIPVALESELHKKLIMCHRKETEPCSFNDYLFQLMDEERKIYEKVKQNENLLAKYGKECLEIIREDAKENTSRTRKTDKKTTSVRVTGDVKEFIKELAWFLYVKKADVWRMIFIKDCKKKLSEKESE